MIKISILFSKVINFIHLHTQLLYLMFHGQCHYFYYLLLLYKWEALIRDDYNKHKILFPWLINILLKFDYITYSTNPYIATITVNIDWIINEITKREKIMNNSDNVLDSTGWPFQLYFQFVQFLQSKFFFVSL